MNRPTFSKLLGPATAVAILCGMAAPVAAQQNAVPPAAAPAQDVDETHVAAFAEASLAVEEVVERWNPRIQGAESPDQAEELRTEASREMVQAIQDSGLEVQTYDEIYRAAQANPELAMAIQREREERQ
ncbi:DUF4168 domain-containing protein [Lutibaculum baratangense]|uniref:DUF4168 domain-containing protein n=1 Tax=Lutibaculum baratangense AMV1 TaxID=631454 RepID=V4QRY2_9HYPH|nr:DUF4168 domain-containing protein [Lutibaculum baratangense]ESR22507.1 hypothetical protein N177_4072 [Lutibaculum baratangense AMV1]